MFRPTRAALGALLTAFGVASALACADANRVTAPDALSTRGALVGSLAATSGSLSSLATGTAGTLCLDVENGKTTDGARAVVAGCVDGRASQQLVLNDAGQLKVYGTLCMDASGEPGRDGNPVLFWGCHGGTNQKWRFTDAGEIRGIGDDCVTINGTPVSGTRLVMRACDGRAGQKWSDLSSAGTGTAAGTVTNPQALVTRAADGLCSAVAGDRDANGAVAIVAPCADSPSQRFAPQSSGEVKVYDNLCMDASGEPGRDGNPVLFWGCHGGTNQKWRFTDAGEIRGIGDDCVTINGTPVSGTRLVMRTCDGRASQKWSVGTVASGTVTPPVSEPVVESGTGTAGTSPSTAPQTPDASTPPTSNAPSVFVAAPELPRTYLNSAAVGATGRTTTVRAGDDLQKAIDAAQPGDVLLLQAGATFSGNFVLRNKSGSGWITIRTSTPDGTLPGPGSRVTPRHAGLMPRIVTPNVMSAIATAPGAHHYRLVGLDVTTASSVTWAYTLVSLGDVGSNQRSLDQVPHDIVLDRMYVHGNATLDLRRCVALNTASTAVVDSWLSDCHARGSDSQAIAGWNGPGPFKIVNNYLEGAGENIMFGGSDPSITNLIPSDIEIRRNHVVKPLSWQGVWTVKNLFELKNSRRVLVEGNVFENNWADAQTGFAILMKSVNQDGNAPWSQTSDVTFQYNIIRRVGAGLSLAGRPESAPAVRMARVRFANNVFEQLGDRSLGSNFALGRLFQVESSDAVEIAHNTGYGTSHGLLLVGAPATNGFALRDNLFEGGPGITSADGKGMGIESLNYHVPGWKVTGNVIGTSYAPDRLALLPTGNTYTSNGATAGRSAQTTDGAPAGADRATINARTSGVVMAP